MQLAWMTYASVGGVAALLTAIARRYALRRHLLDLPGERRSHVVATPRGGGIAIVISQLLAFTCVGLFHPALAMTLAVFGAGLLMVAGVGWWDDHRPLPALPRLCVHLLAGLLLGGLVWYWTGSAFKGAICAPLAVFLINVWNFMDGIDGLAATQAVLAALACALLLPGGYAGLALLLAVGVVGFLPFNFPKARIFMGDVGSGALGYLLAGLVALGMTVTDIAWPVWLVPLTAFGVDAGLTLCTRMLNGEKWMEAHKKHLYQRYVAGGASHARVTGFYALFTVVAAMVMLVFSRYSIAFQYAGAFSWLLLSAALWNGLRSKNSWQKG